MSFEACIQRAVRGGEMNADRAAAVLEDYRQRVDDLTPGLGRQAARAAAAVEIRKGVNELGARQRRQKLMQLSNARDLSADLDGYRNFKGINDLADALVELLEWGQAATFDSVERIRKGVVTVLRDEFMTGLEAFGPDILGRTRQKALQRDMVREIRGEATGSASARELAQAWRAAAETARRLYNAAGGHIAKLKDWDLPHSHDWRAIKRLGMKGWVDRLMRDGVLDWDRMVDFETGQPIGGTGAGASIPARRAFLEEIWKAGTSEGWSRREASFVDGRGKATANRRADHRVLQFKSADAWFDYNAEFGRADVYTTMIHHLDGMARDIALMRRFGPNPRAGMAFAKTYATKQAHDAPWDAGRRWYGGKDDAADKVSRRANLAENMFDHITGAANEPSDEVVAKFLGGTRHSLYAAQLGGAVLSSVSDAGTSILAAQHVGLDPKNVLKHQARLLASSGARDQARRMGVAADSLADATITSARFMLDTWAPPAAQRLSQTVLRASGLTHWTDSMRGGARLGFMAQLADDAGRSWGELDPAWRDHFLAASGFTEADWDVIRKTPLHIDRQSGADFLNPLDIRHRQDLDPIAAENLALKLQGAILDQIDFFVPTASVRARASVLGGTRPGTLMGEAARSGIMYKAFPLALMYGPMKRVLFAPVKGPRIYQIAKYAAVTTIFGAMAVQNKEVAKGRDPRDMTTKEFIIAAFLQGGGLGIFGDFAYAMENRYGGGPAKTALGPLFGFGVDAAFLVKEGVSDLFGDGNFGRDLVAFAKRYTPGSSLWYARLVFERLVFDEIQMIVDPEASSGFRRRERARARDYGNDSYWRPGDMLPIRPPDFSKALGGAQ